MDVPSRPVLVAPDSFKGTIDAGRVANAVCRGLSRANLAVDVCPVADGGEGTLSVMLATLGGTTVASDASDPLGRRIEARFALLGNGETAIVEVAAASGLSLVTPSERDAESASSRGTGELVVASIDAGASHVLVAAGGSATTDGGAGAIDAIESSGGLRGARLTVLCDVRTPFELAARVFAPQKGADAAAVARLERRLAKCQIPRGIAMTGAAGGLSGGLWARLGARLVSGATFVLDAVRFDQRMLASRAVITGEGRLDVTSLEGKITSEIATRARQSGVPLHAIVGRCALSRFDARILDIQEIREASTTRAIEHAAEALAIALVSEVSPPAQR
jgi:glycerate kinase